LDLDLDLAVAGLVTSLVMDILCLSVRSRRNTFYTNN